MMVRTSRSVCRFLEPVVRLARTGCGKAPRPGAAPRHVWSADNENRAHPVQKLSFSDFTAKALQIVRAGFAFTCTIFPKAIRFPALVAGFFRSLIIVTPGMVNFPLAFRALGASASSPASTAFTSFFFTPDLASRAVQTSLFDIALPAFFIAFMITKEQEADRHGQRGS